MKRLILLLMLLCAACQMSMPSPTPSPTHGPLSGVTLPVLSPTITALPSTPTLAPSPTPAPYEQYTVDFLRRRTYGGGKIEIVETMEDNDLFTRYAIRYPSDGLSIYGFANVPKGEGPFPLIVAVHGFVDVATYQTLDYTTPAVDGLTQAGYIVLHPNLRNYPPSDNGDNLFRVGMTIDVLNLIALVKSEAGPSELFARAAPEAIGLWGHSMGGEIVLRALTVSSDVKAALLYASMSGNEIRNSELLSSVSSDPTFQTELTVPASIVDRISPASYYTDITAPIQLHHGTADGTVPFLWAQRTCESLKAARVQVECFYYPEEGHTFRRRVMDQFSTAVLGFYQKYLSP